MASKKGTKGNKKGVEAIVPALPQLSSVTTTASGNIRIVIEARPNAKTSSISDFGNDAIGVRIAAPPRDGEANEELVRFLAEDVFRIRTSMMSVDRGGKSRAKVVSIDANTAGLTLQEVIDKLKSAADESKE
jgi:uncharacterized protein (TIGR00251 family)